MKRSHLLSGRQDLLIKILLVIAGPVLLIGILEGAAYLWERRQANSIFAWELVASRRLELIRKEVGDSGYTLMNAGDQYEWQGIPVNINSHGLRGPETTIAKPEDTFRILNLGDSVAMGWGVREEESYGQRLEEIIADEMLIEQNIEVINASVPGWNPENELAYLKAEGFQFEPDLILLDLTLVNDIYGQSALLKNQRPAVIEWLRTNTYTWPFLSIQMQWMAARSEGQERIEVIDPPDKPASYFPLDPSAEQWSLVWESIQEMNDLAAEREIPFVILLFPLEFQVLDNDFPTLPQEILTTRAAEAGIPTVDLLAAFQEACLNKSPEPCMLEDRYLFADVWMHPSAFGHELTADTIFTFLQSAELGQ